MELKPNIYYKTILQYREAELLFEALKLDIFSYLDEPTTLEEFLKSTNYDKENTKYFLSALLSCGYIEKNNLCQISLYRYLLLFLAYKTIFF